MQKARGPCILGNMTTLQVADEPLPQAVAARLRGLLAERKISHKEFGEMVGWPRGIYQRRLSGEIPLDLSDLERIERAAGITVAFLLTGDDEKLPTPPRPPAHPSETPSRGGQLLRLHPIAVDETADAGELVSVSEDAQSYIALADGLPLPRLDSNQQPFGDWFDTGRAAA